MQSLSFVCWLLICSKRREFHRGSYVLKDGFAVTLSMRRNLVEETNGAIPCVHWFHKVPSLETEPEVKAFMAAIALFGSKALGSLS